MVEAARVKPGMRGAGELDPSLVDISRESYGVGVLAKMGGTTNVIVARRLPLLHITSTPRQGKQDFGLAILMECAFPGESIVVITVDDPAIEIRCT
jgi:hypothetical protein